jgi:hypothetical protein
MKLTAYLSGSTATITRTEEHNVTAICLDNATKLGSQLLAFISQPNAGLRDYLKHLAKVA